MKIRYVCCLGGPIINYSFPDENTVVINGESYFFDPSYIQYDNIKGPEGTLFSVYDIYRDAVNNELHATLFFGYTSKELLTLEQKDGEYHDPR